MRTRFYIKIFLWLIAAAAVLGYGYGEIKNLIRGASLIVERPREGEVTSSKIVEISGTAKRISAIYLNDRQIFVDSSGRFSENVLLAPGYNVLKVAVRDKFGSVKEKITEVIYAD